MAMRERMKRHTGLREERLWNLPEESAATIVQYYIITRRGKRHQGYQGCI